MSFVCQAAYPKRTMKPLKQPRSIERLQKMHDDIDFGSLSSFIMNNSNLQSLVVEHGDIALENSRILALAGAHLAARKSLSRFCLTHNNLSNDGRNNCSTERLYVIGDIQHLREPPHRKGWMYENKHQMSLTPECCKNQDYVLIS